MSKYLYLDRNTFFHRLDPRTKLLLTLAHFIASAALVEQLWLGGFVVFETLLLTTLSRSWKNIRKIRIILISLALMTLLSWLIFGTGTTPLLWIIKKEDLCHILKHMDSYENAHANGKDPFVWAFIICHLLAI